jgi:branched-chain amino acid transport system substrate-binding protein
VLNDQAGLYCDIAGMGSVCAAKKAIEDFGAAAKGMKVEIMAADHLNKPDVGSKIARQWFDLDKVDAIADVPTSSVPSPSTTSPGTRTRCFLPWVPRPRISPARPVHPIR